VVCTDRAQHVQFARAIHGSHLSPVVLGKLYRERTDTSARPIDQNPLSALEISQSKKVQCISSAKGNGGGFLISHIGRFYGHAPFHFPRLFRQTNVLGISTKTHTGSSKYLVTFFEQLYIFTYGFNFPG